MKRWLGVAAVLHLLVMPANAAEKVSLQLRWDHQFQFAGYYAALWQGYYADAGLDVEIRSAFTKDWKFLNTGTEVAEKRADFGATGSDILLARNHGTPLTVLATIFQESPFIIFAKKGTPLATPADLTRLNLGLYGRGGIGDAEIKSMLVQAGMDPEKDFPRVTLIKKAVDDIIAGRIDAAAGYTIDIDWYEKKIGGKITVLKPSTYGVNFYGDTLFTRRSLVEQKPEMVQAFVKATIQGWHYALLNGEEIADRIARDLPRKIPVADLKAFNRSLIKPVIRLLHFPLVPLGNSDLERWRQIHAAISKIGIDAGTPPGDDFVYDPERVAEHQHRTMIVWTIIIVSLAAIMAVIAWIVLLRKTVTARTQALSTSEEHYRKLIESNNVIAWEVDLESWCFTYVSPPAVDLMGYQLDQWYAEGFWADHIHPDDREQSINFCTQATERGEDHDFEYRMIAADGRSVWLRDIVTVVKEGGRPVSLRGFLIDITERKQAELNLQESEERYAFAVSGTQDGLWDWNVLTNENYMSPRFKEILGYQDSELENKVDVFFNALHPDDAERIKEEVRAHFEEQVPYNTEYRLRRKDGSYIWIHAKGQAVWGSDGKPLRMAGSISDVTERKQLEERLSGAIESLQEGFALFDADDRLVAINDVFKLMNPMAQEYMEKGLRFEDMLRGNVEGGRIVEAIGREEEFIRKRMDQHCNPGAPILRQHSDGRWGIVRESRTPEGGIALTISDITERKLAEDKLHESEERFSAVVDGSPNAVLLKDRDGRFLIANKKWHEWFNPKGHDIAGKTIYDFHNKAHGDNVTAMDRDVLETELTQAQEFQLAVAGGVEIAAILQKFPVYGADGTVVAIGSSLTDITERKQAEMELQESEKRFRGAVESMQDGFVLYDSDDRIVAVNDVFRQINPKAQEFLDQGMSFEDIIRDNTKNGLMVEAQGRGEEFIRERLARHRKPGPVIIRQHNEGNFYKIREHPTPDGGIAITFTDITEIKLAQLAAEKSEERTIDAIESLSDGFIYYASDRRLVYCNDRYREFYPLIADLLVPGARLEDIARASAEGGQDAKPIDDVDAWVKTRIADFESGRKGHEQNLQTGRTLLCSESRTRDGGYVGIRTDITDRKHMEESLMASEARLAGILDIEPEAVIAVGAKFNIRLFNQGAERIFGYDADEVIGQSLEILMPERFRKNHKKHIEGFDRSPDTYRLMDQRQEIWGLKKDGKEFPASASVSKIEINGEIINTVLLQDITERKQVEESLHETEKQLHQAQKMEAIGQLTGGIAHDFNNLMQLILGSLEMAIDADTDEERNEVIADATNAVHRGAILTDQLLSFSRQHVLNPKISNAEALLRDMTRLMERTLGEDIEITTVFADDLPSIKIDPAMLGNAILNLANNARDAMPKGGVLLIDASVTELDGEFLKDQDVGASGLHVQISVSDSGSGMDVETLSHVFEPFFTTKEVGEGSGLGLSMVYGFAKQSGGYITIDSEKGEGTTVSLYFPVADEPPANRDDKPARPKAEAMGEKTILVVEDDEDVRRIAVKMLNSLGYEVLEADNGRSALDLLEKNGTPIDLVFSDVVMPAGMSGFDLAHELRQHYQGIEVLMTSGYPEKIIDQDNPEATGIALLRKPYNKAALAEAVRLALDQQTARNP